METTNEINLELQSAAYSYPQLLEMSLRKRRVEARLCLTGFLPLPFVHPCVPRLDAQLQRTLEIRPPLSECFLVRNLHWIFSRGSSILGHARYYFSNYGRIPVDFAVVGALEAVQTHEFIRTLMKFKAVVTAGQGRRRAGTASRATPACTYSGCFIYNLFISSSVQPFLLSLSRSFNLSDESSPPPPPLFIILSAVSLNSRLISSFFRDASRKFCVFCADSVTQINQSSHCSG